MAGLIVLIVVAAAVLLVLARTVRIVPQARAGIVERLGRYQRTLDAGLALVIPFVDRLRPLIDLREQVVSFDPQPVITEDNLVVHIDTVVYFQVTDPKSATYEIADYIAAIEQLTVTTLRNVVGGMTLEDTLTSRDEINTRLRGDSRGQARPDPARLPVPPGPAADRERSLEQGLDHSERVRAGARGAGERAAEAAACGERVLVLK